MSRKRHCCLCEAGVDHTQPCTRALPPAPRQKRPEQAIGLGPELHVDFKSFFHGTYTDEVIHATVGDGAALEDIREALRQEYGRTVDFSGSHVRFEDPDAWYDHGDVEFETDENPYATFDPDLLSYRDFLREIGRAERNRSFDFRARPPATKET